MDKNIIVRIAPSPTGNLHIGTARASLFNFLFARQNNGKFIVRIEDTDKERSTKEFDSNILESLDWLQLKYDALYRQSEREDIYKKYLKKMIDDGFAYVSKEEVKEAGQRSEVIRFKNPNKTISFEDLVRGTVTFDTTELKDFIIARSETEPLYHLAVVIDDFEMNISHVIRGEDHISNTPRQILIGEAIGAPRPIYGHIPLILAPDRSKLSKRHGATSIIEYKDKGYLPEAIINYLALLGWNPGTEQEIFTLDELTKVFDIGKIQKGGAVFDEEKLKWIDSEHRKKLPLEEKNKMTLQAIKSSKLSDENNVESVSDAVFKLFEISGAQNTTVQNQKEMIDNGEVDFLIEAPKYDKENLLWKDEKDFSNVERHIEAVIEFLEKINEKDWNIENIKNSVWDYATKEGRGSVLWPMRYALSGKEKSSDPFVIASVLSKKETISRLKFALELLQK